MGNGYMPGDVNLDDYISQHPDAVKQLRFEDNDSRTAFVVDTKGTRLAEMWMSDIRQGIKNETEFLPGVTYKNIADNTSEYQKEHQPEVEEVVQESFYNRNVNWLNKHKKTTLTSLGTFAGIMLLYAGCELKEMYSEPDYRANKVDATVANTPGYKLQKDINQAKALLSDYSPIQLDNNGYAKMAKSYSSKVEDYRKKGLDADKVSELEELAKQFVGKRK
jgi:hypothetical protein